MPDTREPLAYRMSPRTLEEFIGQEEVVSKGKLLYRMIKADRISSIILFGPPGTGKTSLARIIAATTKASFEKLNAVTAGVGDIRKIISDTENRLLNPNGKTVLFVDEIHRFNKAQQDALLPFVENGTIVLIGATTENPYYEVNKALISRSSVFMLKPLTEKHIMKITDMALNDRERGLGYLNIDMSEEAKGHLANICNGDARVALNAVELAVMTSEPNSYGKIHIDLAVVEECVQKRALIFDKTGDNHYDNISAMIKSMRGSDPDAAVFYLARAIYAGEAPEYLARRIIIAASEDVGMANSAALQTAVAAAEAVRMVGMPEGRIILAHAAIMVATSPKSNSCYMAVDNALNDIQNRRTGSIPLHLRSTGIEELHEKFEYGKGYLYPHDYPNSLVNQEYLPEELKGTVYYKPGTNGYEAKIKEWLDNRRGS